MRKGEGDLAENKKFFLVKYREDRNDAGFVLSKLSRGLPPTNIGPGGRKERAKGEHAGSGPEFWKKKLVPEEKYNGVTVLNRKC